MPRCRARSGYLGLGHSRHAKPLEPESLLERSGLLSPVGTCGLELIGPVAIVVFLCDRSAVLLLLLLAVVVLVLVLVLLLLAVVVPVLELELLLLPVFVLVPVLPVSVFPRPSRLPWLLLEELLVP
jgi:hypothetical protein